MRATCEQVLSGLEAYLDGELREDAARTVAEHLDACPECLDHEAFVTKLRGILRGKLGHEPLPVELAARIGSDLARRRRSEPLDERSATAR